MIEYILILMMVVCTVCGQLLIKRASQLIETDKDIKTNVKSFLNKYLIMGAIVILLAPVFYLSALSRMDLSVAFAFTGLNYVFVVLGAKTFFSERVSDLQYLGAFCIFLGLAIFNI